MFPVNLDQEFHLDIIWWCRFVPAYNGVSLIQTEAWDHVFATDSTLAGCGGFFKGKFFHRCFPQPITDLKLGNTHLGLLTIVIACKLWGPHFKRHRILVFCDSQAVCGIVNSGRSKKPFIQAALRELWFLQAQHDFSIHCEQLPGVDKRIPHALSRWDLSQAFQLYDLTQDYTLEECEVSTYMFQLQFNV